MPPQNQDLGGVIRDDLDRWLTRYCSSLVGNFASYLNIIPKTNTNIVIGVPVHTALGPQLIHATAIELQDHLKTANSILAESVKELIKNPETNELEDYVKEYFENKYQNFQNLEVSQRSGFITNLGTFLSIFKPEAAPLSGEKRNKFLTATLSYGVLIKYLEQQSLTTEEKSAIVQYMPESVREKALKADDKVFSIYTRLSFGLYSVIIGKLIENNKEEFENYIKHPSLEAAPFVAAAYVSEEIQGEMENILRNMLQEQQAQQMQEAA